MALPSTSAFYLKQNPTSVSVGKNITRCELPLQIPLSDITPDFG